MLARTHRAGAARGAEARSRREHDAAPRRQGRRAELCQDGHAALPQRAGHRPGGRRRLERAQQGRGRGRLGRPHRHCLYRTARGRDRRLQQARGHLGVGAADCPGRGCARVVCAGPGDAWVFVVCGCTLPGCARVSRRGRCLSAHALASCQHACARTHAYAAHTRARLHAHTRTPSLALSHSCARARAARARSPNIHS